MQVTQVEMMYKITFHNSKGLSVNCYLVEENDYLTLIDTAMEEHAENILRVARDIGKPINNIILTHAHHDHIGGLDKIKQLIPHSTVYISRREAPLMYGDISLNENEPKTQIRGIFPKKIISKADILLQDGERIGSLLALFTPGHTPGSMSFIDTRNNTLIAGDAFQTIGGLAVAGQMRPSFPFPAKGTWNNEIALESARKIQDSNPSILAVGHGEIVSQPLADITIAIAEADLNVKQEKNS
ncbi:metallo-beta-lactamase [Bacillus sp. SA1-12]|uniref:MBL fold metallo-hydrolase n=1 Tax=Bacillus sp. SA1-12 TaxID=1455638 RepID=UPI000627040D|nr:MBL fold metallo-hydrolase [Bacillus sp. SA1-12]KKI90657.1 metallo-beta-lactamase [Bacillus sp. SA1-12]